MTIEEWEYTLPEKDKVYNFVFSPKTANGAEKVEECSRFVASNNDRYKLPRVVVETKDNVFPTSDWVI